MKYYRCVTVILCVWFMAPSVVCAQISAAEALSEFVAAGIAYKEGRYESAVTRYENVIKGGRVSGALHYNLGNSYYKLGELGKASLNYERALRLIPRDSDLRFNRAYLASKIDRGADTEGGNIIDRMINGFIHYYTSDEMVLILYTSAVLGGLIYLLHLYLNWAPNTINSVMAVIACVFIVFSMGLGLKVEGQKNLAVIMSDTKSYFEPRTDSTVHFKMSEGMKAEVVKSELNWAKVRRLDGKVGWIAKEFLERI